MEYWEQGASLSLGIGGAYSVIIRTVTDWSFLILTKIIAKIMHYNKIYL